MMKKYKEILYAAVVLSLVSFFAITEVSAHMEADDAYYARNIRIQNTKLVASAQMEADDAYYARNSRPDTWDTKSVASAHMKVDDAFSSGQKAGISQVQKDFQFQFCAVENIRDTSKEASGKYISNLIRENRSENFIDGFKEGYENTLVARWHNCGR